jgi:hypothetical protein|tara:strand:+ start:4806 stop:5333 length:528 start_codon:yes stop_codon:yes gene_type:complete
MTAEVSTASSTASRLIKEGAEQDDIYDTLVAEFRALITNNVGADVLIAWLHPLFTDKARWSGSRATNAIVDRKADEARYDEIVRIDDGKIVEGSYAHLFDPMVMDKRVRCNGRFVFFKHMTRADFLNKIDEINKNIAGNIARRASYEVGLDALDALNADTLEEAARKVTVFQKAA